MQKQFDLSVHDLVDFLLRKGDIDNRIYNQSTMQEGSVIHAIYQSKRNDSYMSEYFLKEKFEVEDFVFSLEGRADGVFLKNDKYYVEEIKSTTDDLNNYFESQQEWHLGQAKCYALMLAHEKGLQKVHIKLTYINQLNQKIKLYKHFSFSIATLEKEVYGYMIDYLNFYRIIYQRTLRRDESVKDLPFPFEKFRRGQRELAKYSYKVANDGGILFAEAPTGIGKTMSTLYPSVKSFANGINQKIFYLTAKTSGKEAAYQAVKLLKEKGLEASEIIITAKDKICPLEKPSCNPDDCPFAKDYYSKLKKVLLSSIETYDSFSKETILKIACENEMCPFELSLDLSLLMDIVICDYNYFFDPFVYLKRYFDGPTSNDVVLVDEAHNLVDRGRDMYSASLSRRLFFKARKCLKEINHPKIKSAVKKLSQFFDAYSSMDGETTIPFFPRNIILDFDKYSVASIDVLKHFSKEISQEFIDFSFELMRFRKLLDFYDSSFSLSVKNNDYDLSFNLICLDPSQFLESTLQKVRSKIIFSATLSPSKYYLRMIANDSELPMLSLKSPFSKENLCVMVAPKISVRYKDRDNTLANVASYIESAIRMKTGNYFVYAPSFDYLNKLLPYLNFSDIELLVQQKEMSEIDKEKFLKHFVKEPKRSVVGLAVVGGAFSEGIDLVSDRLIGVIIIGVGFPQICFERERIKEYFDINEEKGFVYSYINPGINKIMQAVGRVIRSENDRGMALLIDDRYLNATYHDLFSNHWNNYKVVTSKQDVEKILSKFWQEH